MVEVDPLDEFDRDLGDLQTRLLALRDANLTDDRGSVVPQLEAAAEQLRRVYDGLTVRAGDAAQRQVTLDRERLLLRAVFHGLPTAVLLVDREGRVRRANAQAHTLLAVSADYLSGQPLVAFLDAPDRSTFRIRLATLLRSGDEQVATVSLLVQGRRTPTRLALRTIELPSDPRPLVLVLATPTAAEGETPPARPGPTSTAPDSDEIRAQAKGGDMVGEVMRILLAENGSADAVVLQRAAARLSSGFADWVVADTMRENVSTRVAVAAPASETDSLLTQSLERADVMAAPLPFQVLGTGTAALQPHLDDLGGLGSDERGVSYLGAIGAHSVLCAPIIRAGAVVGALTMVRTGNSGPFRLAELAAAEEIGDLLGRTLSPPRGATVAPGSTDAAEPFLPQRMLSVRDVDIAWVHMGGQGGTAPFLDFYEVPGGWGLALGSAPVGGGATQAYVAMVRQWAMLLGSDGRAPADVLSGLDEGLRRLRPGELPVSAAVLTLMTEDDRLTTTIASAGHRSSLCVRSDGRVQRTDGGGNPLNDPLGPATHVDQNTFGIGECLVVYTNELCDVRNEAGQTFAGSGELANSLARVAGQPARRVIDSLTSALTAFAPASPTDAVVALAVRYTGPV